MKNFYTILTQYGKNALAEALAAQKKLAIPYIAVGDSAGEYYEPSESQTNLRNERWRGDLNDLRTDDDHEDCVIAEAVIPFDIEGDWVAREIGLYDAKGGLVAVGKYPETYIPSRLSGSAKQIYINMVVRVGNVAAVSLIINPDTVLASKLFVMGKGYGIVGSFESGLFEIKKLTNAYQLVLFKQDNSLYRWCGEFPKVVLPGSSPELSGGIAKNAWQRIGGDVGVVVKKFDTVSSMLSAASIPDNGIVETLGYFSAFDGGNAFYGYSDAGNGDGVTSFPYKEGYLNLIPTSSINAAALGIKYGEGAADINAIKAAIKYLQNDVEIDKERIYSKDELQQLHTIATRKTSGRPQTLLVTGLIDHIEPLHIIGGFSIITPNNKGAYPNTIEDAGFFYSGTDADIGLTTGVFIKVDGGFKLVTTLNDVKYLHRVAKQYFGNVEVITDKITWATSFGAKNGTPIGVVIGASSSKFDGCNFGMTNALAKVAFVGFECWDTNFDACCFNGKYQAAAWLSCNSSCVQREPYYTSAAKEMTDGVYTLHPESSQYHDFNQELIAVYYGYASCTAYAPKHETNGLTHMAVADMESIVTYHGQYYETHNPEYNIKTCLSMYDNSSINTFGGFIPASYYAGTAIYRENIDRNRPCYFNAAFTYNGGYLYEDFNCGSKCNITPMHGRGYQAEWGLRAISKQHESLINVVILGVKYDVIQLNQHSNYNDFNNARALESAVYLCQMFDCTTIELTADYVMDKDIQLPAKNMHFTSNNGAVLVPGKFKLQPAANTRLILNGVNLRSYTGEQDPLYSIISGNDGLHVRLINTTLTGGFGIMTNSLLNTGATLELLNVNMTGWYGRFFIACSKSTQDSPIVFVDKERSALPATVRDTPFKNISNGIFRHL
ncbi:phage tail-collar fiber domain-containing protein [Providencia hangzhouensis]